MRNGLDEIVKEFIRKGKQKDIQEGLREGIDAFIADKLEDGVDHEIIRERLIRHFCIKPEEADEYINRCTTV